MGKPKDPDYWRRYRAEHPEYAARERERLRRRKRTPEERRNERQRAAEQEAKKPKPQRPGAYERWTKRWREANHEAFLELQRKTHQRLMEQDPDRVRRWRAASAKRVRERRYAELAARAARMAIRPDERDLVYDPLYEDAYAEALLSLWQNRNKRNRYYSVDDWVKDAADAARRLVRTERLERWYTRVDFDTATQFLAAPTEEI